jgi:hypothetical protein
MAVSYFRQIAHRPDNEIWSIGESHVLYQKERYDNTYDTFILSKSSGNFVHCKLIVDQILDNSVYRHITIVRTISNCFIVYETSAVAINEVCDRIDIGLNHLSLYNTTTKNNYHIDEKCMDYKNPLVRDNYIMHIDPSSKVTIYSSIGSSFSLRSEYVFNKIYRVKTDHVVLIDFMFYKVEKNELVPIEQSFTIKSVNHIYQNRKAFQGQIGTNGLCVLDTKNQLWSLDKECKFVMVCDMKSTMSSRMIDVQFPSGILDDPKFEIFECIKLQKIRLIFTSEGVFVRGTNLIAFIDPAIMISSETSSTPSTPGTPNATVSFEIVNVNRDHNYIMFKCGDKWFEISDKRRDSTIDIIRTIENRVRIPLFTCYRLSTSSNTKIIHWYSSHIYTLDPQSKVLSCSIEPRVYDLITLSQTAITKISKTKVFNIKSLSSTNIYVDITGDVFSQYFNYMIVTKFQSYLVPTVIGSNSTGEGPGRSVMTMVMNQLKETILTPLTSTVDDRIMHIGYRLNMDDKFWAYNINAYYFGKLLGYLANYKIRLSFCFTLDMMYLLKRGLDPKTMILTESLAPFHSHLNQAEFTYMQNLDDECKTSKDKFQQLSLPYADFDDCVLHLLGLDDVSIKEKFTIRELECITNIAVGMKSFNSDLASQTIDELAFLMCGPPIYDLAGALKMILITNRMENASIRADIDAKCRIMLENLNELEMKKFMIWVCGFEYPINTVKLNIQNMKTDFNIATCSHTIVINPGIFAADDYIENFRSYLNSGDFYSYRE